MADLSITAANVVKGTGSTIERVTSGATITAGQLVYLDSADSDKAKLAQGNAAGTSTVYGISLHAALANQPLTVLTAGPCNVGATLAVGQTYVLSAAAAGGIAPVSDVSTGEYVSHIGIALSASNLSVLIRNSGIASA